MWCFPLFCFLSPENTNIDSYCGSRMRLGIWADPHKATWEIQWWQYSGSPTWQMLLYHPLGSLEGSMILVLKTSKLRHQEVESRRLSLARGERLHLDSFKVCVWEARQLELIKQRHPLSGMGELRGPTGKQAHRVGLVCFKTESCYLAWDDLNLRFSCLSIQSTGMIGKHYHVHTKYYFALGGP